MDLGNGTKDAKATGAFIYVQPARPWFYVWLVGLCFLGLVIEIHVYNNASFLQFLLSIPLFALYVFLMWIGFFGAARMEIDEKSIRRSLLGWTFTCIPWENVQVIQGFYTPGDGRGLVGGFRVLAAKRFFIFGRVFFADEAEVLAPKLNLVAKRFGIPLEQRLRLYSKFEKVDTIKFK